MKPQAFDMNGSGGFSFCLKAMMESILVNIQDFTINISDGVCDRACFYLQDVLVCF